MNQPAAVDLKIAAVLSCPVVGWNPFWGCAMEAINKLRVKIPIKWGNGAFWNQTLQNMLEERSVEGCDVVICLDYDTLFTAQHLDRLIVQFCRHPEIDALAALQARRSTDEPLFTIRGVDRVHVTGEPIKVFTAHFGLTLLRMETLKKLPLPWLQSQPAANGSWRGPGHLDADIAFWHKWHEHGFSLFVDPTVRVGHIQPMVAEFDEHMHLQYTHLTDWRQRECGDVESRKSQKRLATPAVPQPALAAASCDLGGEA